MKRWICTAVVMSLTPLAASGAYFRTAAECRSYRDSLYSQIEQGRRERDNVFREYCQYNNRCTQVGDRLSQMDARNKSMYMEWQELQQICSSMDQNERAAQRQEQQRQYEQAQLQRQQQEEANRRMIYYSQQQQALQQQNARQQADLNWQRQQVQQAIQASNQAAQAAKQAQNVARNAAIAGFAGALVNMMVGGAMNQAVEESYERIDGGNPYPNQDLSTLYSATNAMIPDNGVSSAVQEESLRRLESKQQSLLGTLDQTTKQIEDFGSNPWASSGSSTSSKSSFRGTPISTNYSADPITAADNPWASATPVAEPAAPSGSHGKSPDTDVGGTQMAYADTSNPWASTVNTGRGDSVATGSRTYTHPSSGETYQIPAGHTLFRDPDSQELQVVQLSEVANRGGDKPGKKGCSRDGFGRVTPECENKRAKNKQQ